MWLGLIWPLEDLKSKRLMSHKEKGCLWTQAAASPLCWVSTLLIADIEPIPLNQSTVNLTGSTCEWGPLILPSQAPQVTLMCTKALELLCSRHTALIDLTSQDGRTLTPAELLIFRYHKWTLFPWIGPFWQHTFPSVTTRKPWLSNTA